VKLTIVGAGGTVARPVAAFVSRRAGGIRFPDIDLPAHCAPDYFAEASWGRADEGAGVVVGQELNSMISDESG
jgi:hypothetical protein